MIKTVLITGANRGIGLEFVKQYAADQWQVIACVRNLNDAALLNDLSQLSENIRVVQLDINNSTQLERLKHELADTPIDCLINNAGVYGVVGETLDKVTNENLQRAFTTNVCGTLAVCQTFLDLVLKSKEKTIVTLSSKMGSTGDNQSGKAYSYRASKSALNAVMKSLANDTHEQQVRVLTLHPGWVQTAMGGKNALISTEQSVAGMRQVIHDRDSYFSGQFYAYDGKSIPW